MDLHTKHCVPCEGGELPLSQTEIALYHQSVPNWQLTEHDNHPQLERVFVFKNFVAALKFVNLIGALAEKEGHHPDITIFSYKKVRVVLFTHAIQGLHMNDFVVAIKVDAIREELKQQSQSSST